MMLQQNFRAVFSFILSPFLLVSCAFGGEDGDARRPEEQSEQTQLGACVEGDAQGPIRCTHYALRDASQLSTQRMACESRDDSFHTFDWTEECPDGAMKGCEFPDGTAGIHGTVTEWLYFADGSCRSPSVSLGEKASDDDDATVDRVVENSDDGIGDDEEEDSGDSRTGDVCVALSAFGASIKAEIEGFVDEFTQCEVNADCDLVSAAARCPNGSAYGVSYPMNLTYEMVFKELVRDLADRLCGEVPGDNLLCAEISFSSQAGCRGGRCQEL